MKMEVMQSSQETVMKQSSWLMGHTGQRSSVLFQFRPL